MEQELVDKFMIALERDVRKVKAFVSDGDMLNAATQLTTTANAYLKYLSLKEQGAEDQWFINQTA